jgi:hypothetical protein
MLVVSNRAPISFARHGTTVLCRFFLSQIEAVAIIAHAGTTVAIERNSTSASVA